MKKWFDIKEKYLNPLVWIILVLSISCEDTRVEESREPMMQLWVNGDPIDPFTYYGQINTYGEISVGEDGKIQKLLVMHFQREVGRVLPELEHYAAIWVDKDGEDNSDLIDPGLYLNYGPTDTLAHTREQTMDMEIIGSFDYTDFAQSEIYVNEDNKVSGMANGKFWNPYREEEQLGLLVFENIEIGTDSDATFYTGE